MGNVTVTCVYCGMAYPAGTAPHGAQILTDHIKICEKHPLRHAEATIARLRMALSRLVGAEELEEADLLKMITLINSAPVPGADKVNMTNAIQVLIDTNPDGKGGAP